VALSGVAGDNSDGASEVAEAANPSDIAAPPAPSDGFDLAAPDLALAPGKAQRHKVLARLEARLGATDLDWRPLNEGVELKAHDKGSEPGTVVWRGSLTLPQAAQSPSEVWRIAILEYEVFATDPDVAQTDATVSSIASHVASRLVFAAHLAVP
jgi:hypothetical protein